VVQDGGGAAEHGRGDRSNHAGLASPSGQQLQRRGNPRVDRLAVVTDPPGVARRVVVTTVAMTLALTAPIGSANQ
jgi:hypothetical protein